MSVDGKLAPSTARWARSAALCSRSRGRRRGDGVLGEVRSLLTDLQDEMQLLRQVPEIAARIRDTHRIVSDAR